MKDVKCNKCHMVQQIEEIAKPGELVQCQYCGVSDFNDASDYEMRMGRIRFSAVIFSNPDQGFNEALFADFHPFHTELPMHGIVGHEIIMTGYSMLFGKIRNSHNIPFYNAIINIKKGKHALEGMVKMGEQ